jgi:hypothetical protein
MKALLWIGLLALLAAAHDDDFDDEAEIEDEIEALPTDSVTVEKVMQQISRYILQRLVQVVIDVPYLTPSDNVDFFFMDALDSADSLGTRWTRSQAKKDDTEDTIAKYDGVWAVEPLAKDALTGDLGMVMQSKAKHSAVAAKLKKPFPFKDNQLVVQYEVAFQVSC